MPTLAELWDEPVVKSTGGQSDREQTRTAILQNELLDAQKRLSSANDPQLKMRFQADVDALNRELGFGKKTKSTQITQQPQTTQPQVSQPLQSGNFADLWDATESPSTTDLTQTSTAGAGRGSYAGYNAAQEAAGKTRTSPMANMQQKINQSSSSLGALGEAGLSLISGAVAPLVAAPIGVLSTLGSGKYGTPEGIQAGERTAAKVQQGLTYQPKTEEGQEFVGKAAKLMEDLHIPPSMIPEVAGFAPLAGAASSQLKAQLIPKTQIAQPFEIASIAGTKEAQRQSVGAAAVPNETTIQQALSVATPELQAALSSIPPKKVNLPTLQRHIEADSLPVPVRLTEGQATGDIVKISNEQNRRGKDPDLAQRFNEQNGQLIENINEIRKNAAPDVYGTKTIENSQGIIDAYKSMNDVLNQSINDKYQALRDAAGGQFPVDAPKLLENIKGKLQKELLSNEAPKGQFTELERLAKDNNMTFEDYLSLRRNLGDIARTAEDGPTRKAAGYMIEELEKLPLQESASRLKPLADQARKAARDRFQMLEKDPAFKAAVDDSVPADKFIDKFVINGINKNINTMVQHLGKDSPAHQHMAAGTINWLRDKSGIIDEKSNFSQKQYNAALKKLDDVNNLHEIFNPAAASQLKTLGNVANYTQFQPRGAFVNNSNTLVGAMAEKAAALTRGGVEKGLNYAVPGVQLGTSLMEMRARRAAEAETRKALELGAGTKLSNVGKQ
jgi:hypothetical protein